MGSLVKAEFGHKIREQVSLASASHVCNPVSPR